MSAHPKFANLDLINLGNTKEVPAATPAQTDFLVLQTQFDVSQTIQLTLSNLPSSEFQQALVAVPVPGVWVIQWSSGGANLNNVLLVDGGHGVSIALNCNSLIVKFFTSTLTTTKGLLGAFLGAGQHRTNVEPQITITGNINGGANLVALVPPYAKRVEIHRETAATACTITMNDTVTPQVLSQVPWPANEKPFKMDIPNLVTNVTVNNGGAGAMKISAVFELSL